MMPRSLHRAFTVTTVIAVCLALSGCGADYRRQRHIARGQEYLNDGKLIKAQIEFRSALQISPNNGQARYMVGTVAERFGDYYTALGMYQAAIAVDPNQIDAIVSLARLFVVGREPERALTLLKPALKKHPDNPDLLAARGFAFMGSDEIAAQVDAERALKLAPTNEYAVTLLAAIYERQGDPSKAIDLIRATLEQRPKSVDLRFVLVNLYERVTRPEQAEAQFLKIVELHPKELTYRYRLAHFYTDQKRLDDADRVMREAIAVAPSQDDPKLAYADFLMNARSPADGERALASFVAKAPDDYELQQRLAVLQLRVGETDKALTTYRRIYNRAEPMSPAALGARAHAADILFKQGKTEEALALVKQVLDRDPHNDDALIVRGSVALARGDAGAAVADLRAVVRDQPRAVPVVQDLARASLADGEPALAEEVLRNAISSAPAELALRLNLAQLQSQQRQVDDAIQTLEATVKLLPGQLAARVALVNAYLAKRDFDAARASVATVAAATPERALGPYLAGVVAGAQGRFEEATGDFEQALLREPRAGDVLAALTRLEVQRGRTAAAIGRLKSVVASEPDNSAASNLLGETYMVSGDMAEARAWFSRTIGIAPRWPLPYVNLSGIQQRAHDTAGAIQTLEQGLRVVGEEPSIAIGLAQLYEQQNRVDDAIRTYDALNRSDPGLVLAANNLANLLATFKNDQGSLDRAQSLTARFEKSDDGELLDTAGWVLYRRGELDAARAKLELAAQKLPASSAVHYHLAMAQFKSGLPKPARTNLEIALNGSEPFYGVEEARATLAQIQAAAPAASPGGRNAVSTSRS